MPIMLVAALWSAAAAVVCADPGAAAIEFLEKVAAGQVDLDAGADTAISSHVGDAKRREIAGRLRRMALDLADGSLDVGDVREAGEIAGVIVHKTQGYDPAKAAAFAVAMVRTGGRWLAAPVEASFENTGVTLDLESRRRAADLENWMMRQRAIDHDVLREQQFERMRRDIGTRITPDDLRSMTVEAVAGMFLEACRERDALRLLGLAGGLNDRLPDDWASRLSSIESGTREPEMAPSGWRWMSNPEVLRLVVHEESTANDGLFTIGCLDPAGGSRTRVPQVRLLHIDMRRTATGEWQINLPGEFFEEFNDDPEIAGDGGFDVDLLDAFVERLRDQYPAAPQSGAEELWSRLIAATRDEDPRAMIQLVAMSGDDPRAARESLGRAVRLWWQMRGASGGRALVPLDVEASGGEAVALGQLFTFREPERSDIRAFHLVRDVAERWLWRPSADWPSDGGIDEGLNDWRRQRERHWRSRWREAMLGPVAVIGRLGPQSAVAGDDAIAVVSRFLTAAAAGDLDTCLELCAVLDDDEGRGRLLRNLGYELSAVRAGAAENFTAHVGSHLSAVSCVLPGDVNAGNPLFPVVATDDGPRLLLEVDLFIATRQRQFLNNVALDRLENHAEREVRDDLATMLADLNRAPDEP